MLEEMQEKGYKEFFITISDGDDSWDADYLYLNEGVLTDGTEVLDMDILCTPTNIIREVSS